ncbi:MAG: hypothetical protein ACRDKT_13145 [Actinomycetota bacterium]
MEAPSPAQIRIAEAVYRCDAHCVVACELYGSGRAPDALLQSARPMTDVFPWLENELRSSEEELRDFMTAVSEIGARIRRSDKPRRLRSSLKDVRKTRDRLMTAIFGDLARTAEIEASIGVALLETARDTYRDAVDTEDLAGYQSCYALAQEATSLVAAAVGATHVDLRPHLAVLATAFPGPTPPAELVRPETLAAAIDEISVLSYEGDATVLDGALDHIAILIDDVAESYRAGETALAARLASSLFVRSYDPIREEFAALAPDLEPDATRILGFDLRRAINDGAQPDDIASLIARVKELLEDAKRRPEVEIPSR